MAIKTITQIRVDRPTVVLAGSNLVPVDQADQTVAATLSEVAAFVRPGDASPTASGLMSAADKTKLNGVAAGATVNSTDAQLRNRATHTGTQGISTISGLGEQLEALGDSAAAQQADIEALEAFQESTQTELTNLDGRLDVLEAPHILVLKAYTLATLPSASTNPRGIIEVSDATGGPKVVRSNGTAWLILNTSEVVA
ncbi:hypothetical protein FDI24_gp185 [Acidovorax phage ACP17]|uniref:Uncharacterized protein n=1 Tax=Acidovorax phage ACP17 TaxID=2010329 RepID=A0A218M344_9CAUD|nr:hypothetical protein FDI24_gp185 [Acidovorax phage ACP17]ASD50467.1 hypothetical protein [Acidovorax phage ACP17]